MLRYAIRTLLQIKYRRDSESGKRYELQAVERQHIIIERILFRAGNEAD